MSKSTTLIVAAIGLSGLGYFLYKKGLFSVQIYVHQFQDRTNISNAAKET